MNASLLAALNLVKPMITQIAIKVNPNNQIVLTEGNFRKRNKPSYNPPTVSQNKDALRCKISQRKKKTDRAIDRLALHRALYEKSEYLQNKQSRISLDIIKKSQRKPKSSNLNKPKSFTKSSGQRLRECGAAIDSISSEPRFTHCVTLTLPANTQEAFAALASQSGYIPNRLFQPIRRDCGDMCMWFYVWEYQKRGALHLHIALYHPDESEGLWISQKIVNQWHKILCDVGVRTNTDMFVKKDRKSSTIRSNHQHHCQPMQKSLGAYFSKYAGKKESKQEWYCRRFPVSRFWGSSRNVKEVVRSMSFAQIWEYSRPESLDKIRTIIYEIIMSNDCNLQSSYDFDIIKTYADGGKLALAKGQRLTFYCHVDKFSNMLLQFKELSNLF